MAREVLDEHGTKSRRKVFALDEYEGHRYFEIREYYLGKSESEWKPTRKGITLNQSTFKVLEHLCQRHSEKIKEWLGIGYVPEDISRYIDLQEEAAETVSFKQNSVSVEQYDDRRDQQFFRIHHEGGKDVLQINTSHSFGQRLLALPPECLEIICDLLQGYARSKALLATGPAFNAETLFMHLEEDWGRFADAAERQSDE